MLFTQYYRIWLFLAVIMLLLLAGSAYMVSQHEGEVAINARTAANNELNLLASLIKNDLRQGDYQHADEILREWGENNPDVLTLHLLASNGYQLSKYQRAASSSNSLTLEIPIEYSYSGLATLTLSKDLSSVVSHRHDTIIQLGIALFFIAVILIILTQLLLRQRQESVNLKNEIEQRNIAERALRESEERFALAMEGSNDGLWDRMLETDDIYLSTRWKAMLGYQDDELENSLETWEKFIHPDDINGVKQATEDFISGGKRKYEIEFRMCHKNGRWLHILCRGHLERDEAGKPLRLTGTNVDITERKAAAALIEQDREQQTTLRELLEIVLTGGPLKETLHTCLEHIFAVSWLSIQPKGGVFVDEGDGEVFRLISSYNLAPEIVRLCDRLPLGCCHCGRAAATGKMQYAECVDERHEITYPGITDHGHYSLPLILDEKVMGVLVLYLPPHFPRDGAKEEFLYSVAGILAAFIGRYKTQQALEESEQRFRIQVEHAPEAIVILDADSGLFVDANQNALQLFGVSREEFLRCSPRDFSPPVQPDGRDSHEAAMEKVHEALAGGTPVYERILCDTRGREFPSEIRQVRLPALGHKLIRASITDITERKRAEEMLKVTQVAVDRNIDAIFWINMDGVVQRANIQACKNLGYTHDELVGMHVWDFDANITGKESWENRLSVQKSNEAVVFESVNRRKDGTVFPVEVTRNYITFDNKNYIFSVVRDISERKQAEEKLRASEILLKEAQRIAMMGSWEFDLETNVITWSEEVYRIHEVDSGQFTPTYEAFFELIHPDDRERLRAVYQASLENQKPYEADYRILLKDGHVKHIHVKGEAEYRDGRPVRSLGMLQDVTESKLAEEALRKSEERYTLAAQIGRSGAWEMWPEEGKIFFDGNLTRLLGYKVDELSENLADWVDTVPESSRGQVGAAIQSVIDGHVDHYTIEHPVCRKDGSIGWVYVKGQRVSAPGEKPLRLIGSSVDITEIKTVEEALQLTQFAVDRNSDAMFWINPDGRILRSNQQACRSLGYECEELIGKYLWDIDPDFTAKHWAPKLNQMRQKGSVIMESRHRRKDGSTFPVEVTGNYIQFGEKEYVFSSARNITERKQAEQALRQLNEELEERVEKRTRELLIAKDEAERANLAKSEFLSRMSHELRTPLNAILGFAQLLQMDTDHPLDDIQQDSSREIQLAGTHLLDLINEVLDLASIEAGKLTVSLEPVSLQPLIKECLRLIEPLAKNNGIRVVEHKMDSDTNVQADNTRLKQVVLNLLSNAIKYNTKQGSVDINYQMIDDKAIQIRVTDTGTGLTGKQLELLFKPFERLHASNTITEGTGIGLALSKQLVELMQGEIGVESTPGVGSTFWVTLPVAGPLVATSREDAIISEVDLVENSSTKQERLDILYIEDNPANIKLMQNILSQRKNIQLLSASLPGLGLELARIRIPALILLDITLPYMDGYAVMERLRSDPKTRKIPVVAVSANAMPNDIERGRTAGFVDYLTKPLDVKKILRIVDEIIGKIATD